MKTVDSAPATPTPAASSRPRRRPRFGADSREHRRRVVTYLLLAGATVLMVNALVGEKGYLATLRARREYDAAMGQYLKVRTENQQLREQARRLREDPTAIEDAARRDLGLIKPGETLVIVHEAGKTK